MSVMKIDSVNESSQFCNTICSYLFLQLILQITMVISLSGDILYSISNHLFQFVIAEDFSNSSSPRKSNAFKRNFSNFVSNKLKEDFNRIDWNNEIYKDGENIDDVFSIFYKT